MDSKSIKLYETSQERLKTAGNIREVHLIGNYYIKRCREGNPKKQILICISRRLINIIYGMLKNQTEYRMPQVDAYGYKNYILSRIGAIDRHI